MIMPNNLSRVSGDAVLRQMKTKGELDKAEFADMFYGVITELDKRGIYIVECVVAKIMDEIVNDYGSSWDGNSIKSEITRRYKSRRS